ncbi:RNA-binding protein [Megasphaera cerevisiae DSM 20462]|uniref:RNA-binding protein n=1 Tax=Megasphaera cerevisiae DSM 20462 TaxID=1122219 RepID=A0A0J6WUS4_9FIRM|nr:bifunctional oligoribonuclease/PAP phosphatase NrnA [Megasphaera cerevisiae]KMO86299.1 RNA-binding protein [Megasphaera cerevisiae DSM 20462]MCI1751132.1 bifunctional oligoribonuclease/PAP phosphatase NrnA [Megasphaera cerevisiae]OKY53196.1 RNA-binding protein [Megasphaera cerevisiae]SJZ45020.1 phosphoesterase RecJ domain-containing protein [Megasphaera cerevisiae DSM 20462]
MNCSSQEVCRVLQQYDHILLTAHVSPDGDAIGSLLALGYWLTQEGRQAVMVIDDDIDDKFSFLEGIDQIRKPADIVTDASWLTVILDATSPNRTGGVTDLIKGKILNIDHHISNDHFADWEYIRPDFAATGEILTDLFTGWKASISPAMADALYMAVATDCGFFKFSNTTGNTLRMAAVLVDCGARPNCISEHLEAQSMVKLHALSEVLRHIELFDDKHVAGITFTPEVLKYTGEHTGSYIDYARNVKGVDVAFTVKYISAQETRVSLRSKTVDVNAIAAVFGGGGHVRAAGCTIYEPLLTAKKMVVKEIIGHK